MDYSPPGSSVHGILQARILEWVAISFSRGSSRPRDRTQVSHIAGRCFNLLAIREEVYINTRICVGRWILEVKKLPANAGDMGSIPDSGRSLEKEMATHSSILAWRIPWTEEPGGLQSTGSQRVDRTEWLILLFKEEN